MVTMQRLRHEIFSQWNSFDVIFSGMVSAYCHMLNAWQVGISHRGGNSFPYSHNSRFRHLAWIFLTYENNSQKHTSSRRIGRVRPASRQGVCVEFASAEVRAWKIGLRKKHQLVFEAHRQARD
jgi:hypothetical protein